MTSDWPKCRLKPGDLQPSRTQPINRLSLIRALTAALFAAPSKCGGVQRDAGPRRLSDEGNRNEVATSEKLHVTSPTSSDAHHDGYAGSLVALNVSGKSFNPDPL
ncbi:uncharacterized [Tachysurus ichikawai]